MEASAQQQLDIRTPGSGLITPDQHADWQKVLSLLPENVASDPSSQFCNPALAKPLAEYLETLLKQDGGTRVSEGAYERMMVDGLNGDKVRDFLISMRKELALREENPYHGDYHSLREVPQRVQTILKNLKEGVLEDPAYKGLLMSASPAHDLLHAGTGYAQRMTPGLNLSNEERAVIHIVDHAIQAGFNPIQILELQRIVLPTSFFQKPNQLGLDKDPDARQPYLKGPQYDLTKIDNGIWGTDNLAKSILARDYDSDAAQNTTSRQMAQIMALGDVLVTMGSFEEWTNMAGKLFLEARIGQGFFPSDPQSFAKAQAGFVRGHVLDRLEACAPYLKDSFVEEHRAKIEEYAQRLEKAGAAFGPDQPEPTEQDSIFLKRVVTSYMTAEIPQFPKLEGL